MSTYVKSENFIEVMEEKDAKHKPMNVGVSIAKFITNDSVNKLDAQKFNGIDNTSDPILKELVDRSDFKTERQKAGKMMSANAESFVYMLEHEGKWYIDFLRPINYNGMKRKLNWIIAQSNQTYINEGKEFSIFFDFKIVKEQNGEKKLVGQAFYSNDGTNQEYIPEYDIKYREGIDFIPGVILRNNAYGTSDYEIVKEILREISTLSNDMGQEWEKIKTMFNNMSTLFGKGRKGGNIKREMTNGEFVFDIASSNAKFSQGLQAFVSGSTTPDSLIRMMVYLEDRAMKYAMQGRDMDNSGTNKHNAQVSLFNQAHGEYNQVKKQQRERDYLYFFNNIVTKIIPTIKKLNNINIESSIFEQGKIEGMKQAQAQREFYEAQTKNHTSKSKENISKSKENIAKAKKITEEAKIIKKNDNNNQNKNNEKQ